MKLTALMPTIPPGIFPGTPGLATDSMLAGRGGNLTTDQALNSAALPNVTEMNSAVVERMEASEALRRQAGRFDRLQKKKRETTPERLRLAEQIAERTERDQRTIELWRFASEVVSLINQEGALKRYRAWKKTLDSQSREKMEQYEELATGKLRPETRLKRAEKWVANLEDGDSVTQLEFRRHVMMIPEASHLTHYDIFARYKKFLGSLDEPDRKRLREAEEEATQPKQPPEDSWRPSRSIRNDFFSTAQSESQRGYLGFLRARTVAMNRQQHGVRTDFPRFQRVVTGLLHEGNLAKVDKAYQAWLRGLEENSRSQADYYAAIIRGEDPASSE